MQYLSESTGNLCFLQSARCNSAYSHIISCISTPFSNWMIQCSTLNSFSSRTLQTFTARSTASRSAHQCTPGVKSKPFSLLRVSPSPFSPVSLLSHIFCWRYKSLWLGPFSHRQCGSAQLWIFCCLKPSHFGQHSEKTVLSLAVVINWSSVLLCPQSSTSFKTHYTRTFSSPCHHLPSH